ncbi:MAG: hypothetical protein QMD14_05180 [Candidatus Aenigmarchaeota archaeon]|nr:hypothetical protein [Candidatus Aenigmarchaeota archaeon]
MNFKPLILILGGLVILFSVGLLVKIFPSIFVEKGEPSILHFKSCLKNEDCMKVSKTCCSCSMGGITDCINRKFITEYETLKNCSPHIVCPAVIGCLEDCGCVDNICTVIKKKEECVPECKAVGTRSEGWYDSCAHKLIKWERCGIEGLKGNWCPEPRPRC